MAQKPDEEELIEPHRTIRLTLHPCEQPELGEGTVAVRLEMDEAERVYRSLARFFAPGVAHGI